MIKINEKMLRIQNSKNWKSQWENLHGNFLKKKAIDLAKKMGNGEDHIGLTCNFYCRLDLVKNEKLTWGFFLGSKGPEIWYPKLVFGSFHDFPLVVRCFRGRKTKEHVFFSLGKN